MSFGILTKENEIKLNQHFEQYLKTILKISRKNSNIILTATKNFTHISKMVFNFEAVTFLADNTFSINLTMTQTFS